MPLLSKEKTFEANPSIGAFLGKNCEIFFTYRRFERAFLLYCYVEF